MYIPRLLENKVTADLKEKNILFVLGARQVGKTTLLKRVFNRNTTLLNLDIEYDRQNLIQASRLEPNEGRRFLGNPEVLIIDEAHHFPETGRIVKAWYDFETPMKIILSGSSTLELLDKTAESLTGRNRKLYLTPLLFREILATQKWYWQDIDTKIFANQINSLLWEHLVFGGYPASWKENERTVYLDNLVVDFLLKDVLRSDLIRGEETVRKLLLLLAYQTGSEVSINELATNLSVARITVEKYLDLLEKIFVIFRLPAFSSNPRKEIVKSQKIYFWDTGVRNALVRNFETADLRTDMGALWENWVIAEVAKKNLTQNLLQNLYFWRTRDGSEIDLIIKEANGKITPLEIKWSKDKPSHANSFEAQYHQKAKVVNKNNFLEFI